MPRTYRLISPPFHTKANFDMVMLACREVSQQKKDGILDGPPPSVEVESVTLLPSGSEAILNSVDHRN